MILIMTLWSINLLIIKYNDHLIFCPFAFMIILYLIIWCYYHITLLHQSKLWSFNIMIIWRCDHFMFWSFNIMIIQYEDCLTLWSFNFMIIWVCWWKVRWWCVCWWIGLTFYSRLPRSVCYSKCKCVLWNEQLRI